MVNVRRIGQRRRFLDSLCTIRFELADFGELQALLVPRLCLGTQGLPGSAWPLEEMRYLFWNCVTTS